MNEADAKNWRKQLSLMRTVGVLRQDNPDNRRLGEAVDRAKTDALRAAAQNADHSESARGIASAALRAREGAAEPWRLRVPSYLTAPDLARGEALFFGWLSNLRGFALLAAAVSFSATVMAVLIKPPLAGPCLGIFASVLIVWVLLSLLRFKPARLVVLRGDEARAFTNGFRSFVGAELCGFGHVWGLAGPESRERTGHKVASAAGYRALAHALRHLIGLNWESATGVARSAPPVGAAPAWRGLTQNLLLDSADAIIVDITGAADPGVWPLNTAHAQAGCVYVSLWGQGEAAQAALKRAGIDAPCHLYAPDGHMLRRAQFRAAVVAAMLAKREASA